jgi:hypothetical protein
LNVRGEHSTSDPGHQEKYRHGPGDERGHQRTDSDLVGGRGQEQDADGPRADRTLGDDPVQSRRVLVRGVRYGRPARAVKNISGISRLRSMARTPVTSPERFTVTSS